MIIQSGAPIWGLFESHLMVKVCTIKLSFVDRDFGRILSQVHYKKFIIIRGYLVMVFNQMFLRIEKAAVQAAFGVIDGYYPLHLMQT